MSPGNTARAVVAFLALMPVLASEPVRADENSPGRKVYRRTLTSTAWVHAEKGTGTAWVVDLRSRLLVTNHHVVGSSDKVFVYFPLFEDGELIAERKEYASKGTRIRGTVLETDPWRDLAIIQLDSLPENARALKLAAASCGPGEQIHSIGNSGKSGGLWAYTRGEVKQVYRREQRTASGLQVRVRIVETQSPVNPGDSGGPVVNDEGELVGVTCSYRLDARLVSQCIDVQEVKAFAERVRGELEAKNAWPSVPIVVQLASIKMLLKQINTVVKPLISDAEWNEFNTSLKEMLAMADLATVDRDRPLGAYLTMGEEREEIKSGVLLIPMKDAAKFRTALESSGSVKEVERGLWLLKPEKDSSVYVRFAHGYAYLALEDRALLRTPLVDPATVLPAASSRLLSVGVRLQRLDKEQWKNIEQALKDLRPELKGDPSTLSKGERLGWHLQKTWLGWLKAFRDSGDEVWAHLENDPATGQLGVEVRLTARPGSALADGIAALGQSRSRFYGLGGKEPAFRGLVCATLPTDLRKSLADILDDTSARGAPGTFLKMLTSSLRQGNIDALCEMYGPDEDQHYTILGALHISEGLKWYRELKSARDPELRLDVATALLSPERSISVHQIVVPDTDREFRRLFGKATFHWFLGDTVILGVLGPRSLKTLRDVAAEAASSEAVVHGPQVLLSVSLRKLVNIPGFGDKEAKIVNEVIKPGTPDRWQITLEGGRALRLRMSMDPAVLRALAALGR